MVLRLPVAIHRTLEKAASRRLPLVRKDTLDEPQRNPVLNDLTANYKISPHCFILFV